MNEFYLTLHYVFHPIYILNNCHKIFRIANILSKKLFYILYIFHKSNPTQCLNDWIYSNQFWLWNCILKVETNQLKFERI